MQVDPLKHGSRPFDLRLYIRIDYRWTFTCIFGVATARLTRHFRLIDELKKTKVVGRATWSELFRGIGLPVRNINNGCQMSLDGRSTPKVLVLQCIGKSGT